MLEEIIPGSVVRVTKIQNKERKNPQDRENFEEALSRGFAAEGHIESKIKEGFSVIVKGWKGCVSIETSPVEKIIEETNSNGTFETEHAIYKIEKVASE